MNDLYDRLRAVIREKLVIAKAATPGPWRGGDWKATFGTPEEEINVIESAPGYGSFPAQRERAVNSELVLSVEDGYETDTFTANIAYITAHDPAWAIRQHYAALRVLGRHTPDEDNMCWHGEEECRFWPCAEARDLVEAYDVRLDE